jgi:hypothetical protein
VSGLTYGWTTFGDMARKFHYVTEDDPRALCGKWGLSPFANAREQARFFADDKPSKDDCAECRRRLDKLKAAAA